MHAGTHNQITKLLEIGFRINVETKMVIGLLNSKLGN